MSKLRSCAWLKDILADLLVSKFFQAVARGLKDPSFRVIQNHFAISANLGDIAAKVRYHVHVFIILVLKFQFII